MTDNVINLHESDDIEMSEYMFIGLSEDGRMIVRLPEDHATACQLFVILQKELLAGTGPQEEEGFIQ